LHCSFDGSISVRVLDRVPQQQCAAFGGLGLSGYGCKGGSQKLFGFVAMELARIDPSFATLVTLEYLFWRPAGRQ
jgi:hypothetical protein